jgi:hypothetical protein
MASVTSGMYVLVKTLSEDGKKLVRQGKTKNKDILIGAKILVYFDSGEKSLVTIDKLEIVGYYD